MQEEEEARTNGSGSRSAENRVWVRGSSQRVCDLSERGGTEEKERETCSTRAQEFPSFGRFCRPAKRENTSQIERVALFNRSRQASDFACLTTVMSVCDRQIHAWLSGATRPDVCGTPPRVASGCYTPMLHTKPKLINRVGSANEEEELKTKNQRNKQTRGGDILWGTRVDAP